MAKVPVLMVVHAHPDDEASQTGGTLARYAAAGWRTVLITCTDGGQGDGPHGEKPGHPRHDPQQVAALRSRELDLAAVALGVHDLVKLGYPDSGMPDGNAIPPRADTFSRRPIMPMVTRLVRLMRHYQPDVIVTYPSNGLSGHPDHIRTHNLVHAALRNVAADAVDDPGGQGSSTLKGTKLYYIAMSKTRLRAVRAGARAAFGENTWVPPEEMAIDDSEITTVIDVAPYWGNKVRALSAHASQPPRRRAQRRLLVSRTLTKQCGATEFFGAAAARQAFFWKPGRISKISPHDASGPDQARRVFLAGLARAHVAVTRRKWSAAMGERTLTACVGRAPSRERNMPGKCVGGGGGARTRCVDDTHDGQHRTR